MHLREPAFTALQHRSAHVGSRSLQRIVPSHLLTPDGDELFLRLRDAAMAFDQRLRAGFSDTEASQLETFLTRLRDSVSRP